MLNINSIISFPRYRESGDIDCRFFLSFDDYGNPLAISMVGLDPTDFFKSYKAIMKEVCDDNYFEYDTCSYVTDFDYLKYLVTMYKLSIDHIDCTFVDMGFNFHSIPYEYLHFDDKPSITIELIRSVVYKMLRGMNDDFYLGNPANELIWLQNNYVNYDLQYFENFYHIMKTYNEDHYLFFEEELREELVNIMLERLNPIKEQLNEVYITDSNRRKLRDNIN